MGKNCIVDVSLLSTNGEYSRLDFRGKSSDQSKLLKRKRTTHRKQWIRFFGFLGIFRQSGNWIRFSIVLS